MALIATPAGSTANSYVTLPEAEALLLDELVDRTAWDAASDDDKVRALITAARILDVSVTWHGYCATHTQSMAWPRYGWYPANGVIVAYPGIYPDLQVAQAMLASWLLTQRDAGTAIGSVSEAPLTSIKAGPISLDFGKTESSSSVTIPDFIWQRLRAYGWRAGSGIAVPIVRT